MNNKSSCHNLTLDYGLSRVMDEYPNYIAGFIILLSFIANILVLRGVKLTKQRPLSHYFISNIAIAELIDTLLFPFLLHYGTRPWYWIFGKAMCIITYTVSITCSLVVSFTLAAFAIYVCTIVMRPSRRQPHLCAVFIVLAFIWLISLALTTPFIIAIRYKREDHCNTELRRYHCLIKVENPIHEYYINIGIMVCQLIVPFAVVVLSYGLLFIVVKTFRFRARRTHDESCTDAIEMSEIQATTKNAPRNNDSQISRDRSFTSTSASSENGNRKNPGQLQKMEAKLLRMILWMVIVFVICYCPNHIIYFGWRSGWFRASSVNLALIRKHFILLMLLGKVIHPICFGWSSGIIARNFVSCFY